jgi:2-dehydro-3-deoxyphosphogluconate aldolase / (4S)-4-hydroxy-2-oxoglutarate aldolase
MDVVVDAPASAIDRLAAIGVIPVVEIPDADLAEPLADALLDANLRCLEVAFRTPAAEAALKRLTSTYGSRLVIGAGTVLSPEQAERAAAAGADFLVSPGLDLAVVARAQSLGISIFPGICTPTEINAAYRSGIHTMKFFPAEAAGGVAYLDAISAPFKDVNFIPTGGIGPKTLARYLAHPSVVACGGTWIATTALLHVRNFARISQLAAEAVRCAGLARQNAVSK